MGPNHSSNRLFIPQMGLIYSPEEVCIPQIRLIKLILRPGQLQNGRAVIVLSPRELQSIIYNFKAYFKTFHSAGVKPHSAYSVANWHTPFKKSITKMKSEKITHLASKQWYTKELWMRELTARQSDTTLCNSGWQNDKGDLSTQHYGTMLAEIARSDTIRRHNT